MSGLKLYATSHTGARIHKEQFPTTFFLNFSQVSHPDHIYKDVLCNKGSEMKDQ